ncbi:MAG: OmpA/MotB domain protein [Myxococcaceae bacterium]|nr:OmpA/MotB domain protein [Myxococcaceae bacterium]
MIKSLSLVLASLGALSLGCASTPAPEPVVARTEARERPRAPTPQPQRIASNSQCNDWEVFFDTGSAAITEPARAVLGGLAECIQRGDVRDVSIVGSADPRGAAPENLQLGQQRAEAIRAVLVARGCDPSVVRTASVGEARASGDPQTFASERHASVRTRDQVR